MNELEHHGILGMRWGVRRFQKKNGDLTNAGRMRYNKDGDRRDTEKSNKFKLSDNQKRVIKIGAAAAATALAAYGAYKLYGSGKLDPFINRGKQILQVKGFDVGDTSVPKTDSPKLFKRLDHKESVQEAISKVNASGSRKNCYNCVIGTIGRLCGIDMTAKGDTQGGKGLNFDEVCKVFKLDPDRDIKRVMNPTVERITNVIGKRYNEGDVGAIGIGWNDAYKTARGIPVSQKEAHTLNWIIKNGQIDFVDSQAQRSGDYIKKVLSSYLDSGTEASIAKFANVMSGLDLDNDVDLDALKRFVD